ncbi:hypothetical protein CASFOL_014994 [Castilleja foliolosa]
MKERGLSAAYAKEMETYSAKESLLLANTDVQPSLVIVYFGGNDSMQPHPSGLGTHVPLLEYIENMKKIYIHLKSLSEKTRLIFLTSPPVNEEMIQRGGGGWRGLSTCYAGKSKSFRNLTDFPLDDSKDLTKKEHHVNKKRRLLLAHKTFYGTRTGSSSSPNVGPTSLLSSIVNCIAFFGFAERIVRGPLHARPRPHKGCISKFEEVEIIPSRNIMKSPHFLRNLYCISIAIRLKNGKDTCRVLFLMYHYLAATEIYNAIRIFIAGYYGKRVSPGAKPGVVF